jgi:hypothetical protein
MLTIDQINAKKAQFKALVEALPVLKAMALDDNALSQIEDEILDLSDEIDSGMAKHGV